MSARPTLAAIRWRCRRGMLELDQLLQRFVDQRYERMDESSLQSLLDLLALEDDALWAVLTGRDEKNLDSRMKTIIEQIRNSN